MMASYKESSAWAEKKQRNSGDQKRPSRTSHLNFLFSMRIPRSWIGGPDLPERTHPINAAGVHAQGAVRKRHQLDVVYL